MVVPSVVQRRNPRTVNFVRADVQACSSVVHSIIPSMKADYLKKKLWYQIVRERNSTFLPNSRKILFQTSNRIIERRNKFRPISLLQKNTYSERWKFAWNQG